ncbi:sugar phosphate isomerase/epimerase family protein [Algisphaera agarilytica]|uniref:Sugar phosphate isomerase/epimerase n=1 Tax=Algisphaera agarilytica TaxID=1385975 RepID=A0A7X0H3R4_9BACT|nr:TIM barrel protein [Algisphaera agarilytica]MBB6428533.1 sugar phosphate isomerase/epimerase [Algisphaera agarilytica]
METISYRHVWGMNTIDTTTVERVAAEGWDGIEAGVGWLEKIDPEAKRIAERGLGLVAQVYTVRPDDAPDPIAAHLDAMRQQLETALPYQPRLINIHTGEDAWGFAEMVGFFENALAMAQELGLNVAFETHRSRCLFHPRITMDILRELPDLQINADLSHFTCVCERVEQIDDYGLIDLLARHTAYVHCRVGHSQGPQVSDPRIEQWAETREVFEGWWVRLARGMQARGLPFSYCPEFGPPPYLPLDPHTGKPVADLEEIVNWQRGRIDSLIQALD